MSSDIPEQSVPIIIKGGTKKTSTPIRINAYSPFHITESIKTESIKSVSEDWTQSDSDFSVSYVESVVLGSNQQFCQTSSMSHPLTFTFKDSDNNTIFTVTEVAAAGTNYDLHISVEYSGGFFQVEETSESADSNDWSESVFDPSDAEIHLVEVTDSSHIPVCQLVRTDDESDFFLNLEPPV
jgi:hypothetical protein